MGMRQTRGAALVAALEITVAVLAGCRVVPTDAAIAAVIPAQEAGRYGCVACDGPAQFLQIRHLTLGWDGKIVLVVADAPHVRVIDAAGDDGGFEVTAFGDDGQGPGELSFPVYGFVEETGNILVYNVMPPQIVRFSPGGAYLQTFHLPPRVPTNASYDAGSSTLFLSWMMPLEQMEPAVDRWIVGDDATSTLPLPQAAFPESVPDRRNVRFSLAAGPGGVLAIGDSWRYTIGVFDRDGAMVSEFGRELPRDNKPPQVLERETQERDRVNQFVQANTGKGTDAAPPITKELAHFGRWAFDFDERGRLWVLTTRGGPGETVFDVFDPEGNWVATATIPATIAERSWRAGNVFDILGDRLAAVVVDEEDKETVVVWTLGEPRPRRR